MIVRMTPNLTGDAAQFTWEIAQAIGQLPSGLDATVIVGTGDPRAVRPGDPAPRVVVPLALLSRPREIGREQILLADALVVTHEDELRAVTRALGPDALVVVVPPGVNAPLLPGANPQEDLDAQRALAQHPDLAARIPGARSPDAVRADLTRRIAEGVAEAIIAASGRV